MPLKKERRKEWIGKRNMEGNLQERVGTYVGEKTRASGGHSGGALLTGRVPREGKSNALGVRIKGGKETL